MLLELDRSHFRQIDTRAIRHSQAHVRNQVGQQLLLLALLAVIAGLVSHGGLGQRIVILRTSNVLIIHVKVDCQVLVIRE